MVQALVPLKDLVSAKTRLSGILSPAQRRALAQAMVEDVLSALTAHPDIGRVTLVSDDPGADLLACKYGIDALDEQTLKCRGLNPVIEKSCDLLMTTPEQTLIVLHGDIPLLSPADIDAVLQHQAKSPGLVIGTDLAGEGTNLLAFNASSRPEFAFGANSCKLHQDGARKAGIAVAVLKRVGMGLDVDQPSDLALLMRKLRIGGTGYTAQLLLHTDLGEQIDTLLASLDPQGTNLTSSGMTL